MPLSHSDGTFYPEPSASYRPLLSPGILARHLPEMVSPKQRFDAGADQKVAKALTELENCGLRALAVPKVGGERIAVAGGKYRAVCRAAFSLAWAPAWECGRTYKPTALAKLRNPSFVRTSGELVPDIMT